MADERPFDIKVPGVRIVYEVGSQNRAGHKVGNLRRERVLVVCGRSVVEKTSVLDTLKKAQAKDSLEHSLGLPMNSLKEQRPEID